MKQYTYCWLLFFAVLMVKAGAAQTLFVPNTYNTAADEEAFGVAELPNNQFIFTSKKGGLYKLNGDAFAFITDKSGAVLRSKTLLKENTDTAYFANAVFWNADKSISVLGYYYNKLTNSYKGSFCIRIDTNLNTLSLKFRNMNFGQGLDNSKTIQAGANFYTFFSYLDIAASPVENFTKIVKTNSFGDILASQTIDSTFMGIHQYYANFGWGLSKGYDEGHFYLTNSFVLSDTLFAFGSPFETNNLGVLKIDTNLKLLDSLQLTFVGAGAGYYDTFLMYPREVAACSKDNIIIGPFMHAPIKIDTPTDLHQGFGITKFDLNEHKISKNTTIAYDKTKGNAMVNAQNNSMATRYDKVFGIGCYDCGFKNSSLNSYFGVSCYDTNATLKWHHYYGGDAYYNASNIYACKDGSVMVMAVRYDHNTDKQRDFYIFKLDSASGNPTSIVNVSAQFLPNITIFPNPASQYITIKDAAWEELLVYNTMGQVVLRSQKSSLQNEQLDIRSLPAGHYSIGFFDKQNNRTGQSKFIKQSE